MNGRMSIGSWIARRILSTLFILVGTINTIVGSLESFEREAPTDRVALVAAAGGRDRTARGRGFPAVMGGGERASVAQKSLGVLFVQIPRETIAWTESVRGGTDGGNPPLPFIGMAQSVTACSTPFGKRA